MNKPTSDAAVRQFLEQFDNDPEAAINAIRLAIPLIPTQKYEAPKTRIIIESDNLSKTYQIGHQQITALNGVTLQIHEGEFVAITGSSGSGKSTLLQLLGGLDKPTDGNVKVDDVDLSKLSDSRLSEFRGQTIGFVFQFFYLQPFLTLERNLEVPGMFAHMKRPERLQRVRELTQAVGLSDRLNHYPKELSGGQIQRAAVVRALLNNPKLILADEPTGNLDSRNSAEIIDLFVRIQKDFGTTIIIATHDMAIAKRADRIISLKDGVVR